MNVLHISRGIQKMPSDRDGAIESVIYNLSRNMVQLDNNVTILDRLYGNDCRYTEFYENVQIDRLNCWQVRSKKLLGVFPFIVNEFNHFLYIVSVNSYLRKKGKSIDVVHIHSDLMGFFLVLFNKKLRNKMFYTTHTNIFSTDPINLSKIARFNLNLNFFMMKSIKKTIALNEQIKLSCINNGLIAPNKIEVIPNGVNLQLFKSNYDTKCIKQKYNLDGKIIILFVGRIHKIKGIEYLVKAANLIINKYNYRNVQFLLVGPVDNLGIDKLVYDETVNQIKSFNLDKNVILTGSIPIDDLIKLYAACDIFVLPSLAESFGLVITEAMASKKPIVATKTDGALRQVIDKWNGLLVETANETDLAEKIRILIDNEDLRHQLGNNGRYFAEEEFDWKVIAEKYLAVYS